MVALLGGHQANVVAEGSELTSQMMCTHARFHVHEAGGHVGEPRFDLAAREPLPQHESTALVETDEVKKFLPMSIPSVATAAVV
jgi:hypothetical protein